MARSLDQVTQTGNEPCGNEPDPANVCPRQWEEALLCTVLAESRRDVSELNYRVLRKLRARMAVYSGKPFGEETET